MSEAKTFSARLEPLRGNLGWVIAKVPFNVEKEWGSKSRLKVKIKLAGQVFRSSLFPTRDEGHFILVNKKMQRAANAQVGSTVSLTIEPDPAARVVKIPPEFERILKREKALRSFYQQLNHSMRYYIAQLIAEPKTAASRAKRADQMAEQLLKTMEAEIELPPHLRAMLDRTPHARRGWDLLTPLQRRHHLMGYFYYKSPEAQQRRFAKAVDDAVRAATR